MIKATSVKGVATIYRSRSPKPAQPKKTNIKTALAAGQLAVLVWVKLATCPSPTPWVLVSHTMAPVGIACGITRMVRIRHDRWRRWVSANWGNYGNGYDNADWRRRIDMYHEFDLGNR